MNENDKILRERLRAYLLNNYVNIENIGLLRGEMGGVLFFSLLARKTDTEYYNDFCDYLIEDVFSRISKDTPVNFGDGICGIGWCIEYLLRNNLTEGNSDGILEEIDHKVMERDPLRICDHSLETGLTGILLYVTARLNSFEREHNMLPFAREYLMRLHTAVYKSEYDNRLYFHLRDELNTMILKQEFDYRSPMLLPEELFGKPPADLKNLSRYPIGIKNGLTGVALKMII